jgi:hypothetical protein
MPDTCWEKLVDQLSHYQLLNEQAKLHTASWFRGSLLFTYNACVLTAQSGVYIRRFKGPGNLIQNDSDIYQ